MLFSNIIFLSEEGLTFILLFSFFHFRKWNGEIHHEINHKGVIYSYDGEQFIFIIFFERCFFIIFYDLMLKIHRHFNPLIKLQIHLFLKKR